MKTLSTAVTRTQRNKERISNAIRLLTQCLVSLPAYIFQCNVYLTEFVVASKLFPLMPLIVRQRTRRIWSPKHSCTTLYHI